jgi:hypothetical protein
MEFDDLALKSRRIILAAAVVLPSRLNIEFLPRTAE